MICKFLVDEDVPRTTARVLRQAGFDATDVRDVGLGGCDDSEIYKYAQEHGFTLISCDMGFSNLLQYPLGEHFGLIIVRIPDEVSVSRFDQEVLKALSSVAAEEIAGNMLIIEIGRVRIRAQRVRRGS